MKPELFGGEGEQELQLATSHALQSVEGARGDKVSYFNLIPEQYQAAVRKIADNNFSNFAKQFPDFQAFLEVMSYNWLVKKEVFELLVKANGFLLIDESQNIASLNQSGIACLTQSGSYVLIGSGAYNFSGPGAAVAYSKIPLRVASHSDFGLKKGGRLTVIPKIGERLHIGEVKTSPLIAAYARRYETKQNDEASIKQLDNYIARSFADVDQKTIL